VTKRRGLAVSPISHYDSQLVTYRYFQMVNSSQCDKLTGSLLFNRALLCALRQSAQFAKCGA